MPRDVKHLSWENLTLKIEIDNLRRVIEAMAQQMEEVDDREVDVEACGVKKYKASKGFKKGLAKLRHNSFTFNHELAISKATYEHWAPQRSHRQVFH